MSSTPFGIGTFADGDSVFPGVVLDEERVIDVSSDYRSTRQIFETWDASLERLTALASERGEGLPLAQLRALPPVLPRQILQSGANYHKHVVDLTVDMKIGRRPEQSDEEHRAEVVALMDERARSGEPYVFLGAASALAGAFDDIVLPDRGNQHDWELELAVVIGRGGRHITEDRAIEHVAGYTIVNDLTTRDLVQRNDLGPINVDWLRSKNAPTFLPAGPWIVPARFVDDPMDLRIELRLDGKLMQDESTADMIFGIDRLISYASSLVELLPGDLLLTGSPAGNGTHYGRFLEPGDVVEATISGLGAQRNRCVAAGAAGSSRDRAAGLSLPERA